MVRKKSNHKKISPIEHLMRIKMVLAAIKLTNNNQHKMKKLLHISCAAALALPCLFFSSCFSPAPPKAKPNYIPTSTKQLQPRVTIRNNSKRNIVVGVRGPETRYIKVASDSSRTVYLRPGVYKYAAAAPKTKTIKGYKAFTVNKSYTWSFGVN